MKIKVDVAVAKESYELAKGIADLISAIKGSLDDGWQAGKDVPVMVSEVIGKLVPALQGIDQLKAELVEDKEAAIMAYVLPLSEVIGSLLK